MDPNAALDRLETLLGYTLAVPTSRRCAIEELSFIAHGAHHDDESDIEAAALDLCEWLLNCGAMPVRWYQ